MDSSSQAPLGHHERRIWAPDPGASGRRGRRGGPYEVFIPDPIASRSFALSDGAVAAVASAAKALSRLNESTSGLTSLNALASNLLRSESAASSRIEGPSISQRRLARAAHRGADRPGGDPRAAEVLGNVEAMKRAIELGAGAKLLAVDDIREIHRALLRFSADRGVAGVVRTEQNWIGGNDYNPIEATYVPPPPEHVVPLLEDLSRFIGRDDLAPIVQAAVAHAQFENIHPFADGNGRVGRALIYTIFRRRGETPNYIPPISLVLASEMNAYLAGFGAFSAGDVSSWCETFADATERAANQAEAMAAEIEAMQAEWIKRLDNPRKDAAVRQLVSALPEQPVIDIAAGQRLTGKSHVAVQNAVRQLEEARILRRLDERKWGRVWECDELLDLVDEFEEAVAT